MNIEVITGVIRHLLTLGGGILITKGLANESEITDAVGAIVVLIGVGWSIASKYKGGVKPPAANSLNLWLVGAMTGLVFGVGCAGGPSGQVSVSGNSQGDITGSGSIDISTNAAVGIEVTANPNTGVISGGITVSFNREPQPETVALLMQAGAIPTPSGKAPVLSWRLPAWDYRNASQSEALSAALREGATLRRL